MAKKTILIISLLLLNFTSLWAQTFQAELAQSAYEQLELVSVEVIKQSFKPITHMKEGSSLFLFSPGVFRIEDLGLGMSLSAESLEGITLGAGAAYVPSDRWLVYGIFSNISTRGTLSGEWVESFPDIRANAALDFQTLFAGGGYEVLSTPYLSIPLYAGLQLEHYNLDIRGNVNNFLGDFSTTGSGFLWGFSGGMALETRWKFLTLSPYFLYMYNVNSSSIESRLAGFSYHYTLPVYQGGTLGLNFGIKSNKNWSFGASLVNLIPGVTSRNIESDFFSLVCFIAYSR